MLLIFTLYFILYFKFSTPCIFNSSNFLYIIYFNLNYIVWNTLVFFLFLSFYWKSKLSLLPLITASFTTKLLIFQYYIDHFWVKTLLYGYNLIHPTLFYITIYFYTINLLYQTKTNLKSYLIIFYIALAALLLGMYWGGVNSSWGFFWTNDKIEFILLYLIFLLTYILHKINFKKFIWLNIYLFFTLIFYILLIRFDIIFSVHSFFVDKTINNIILFNYLTILNKNIFYILFSISYIMFYNLYIYLLIKTIYLFKFIQFKIIYIYIFHLIFLIVIVNLINSFNYYNIVSLSEINNLNLNYYYFEELTNNFVWFFALINQNTFFTNLTLNFYVFNSLLTTTTQNYIYYLLLGNLYILIYYILISSIKIYIV